VARVRGRLVMNAVEYVVQRFGRAAHERVIAALPKQHWGTFLGPLHEASWEPAMDAVAYFETARALLAPGEEAFYRDAGRFAGRIERQVQGYQPMVKDPATAIRLGPKVWSSFYDEGRLEAIVISPTEGLARIFDFRVSPVLCERSCGAWEGLLSSPELDASTTEVCCIHRAAPHCEIRVMWTPAAPQSVGH